MHYTFAYFFVRNILFTNIFLFFRTCIRSVEQALSGSISGQQQINLVSSLIFSVYLDKCGLVVEYGAYCNMRIWCLLFRIQDAKNCKHAEKNSRKVTLF